MKRRKTKKRRKEKKERKEDREREPAGSLRQKMHRLAQNGTKEKAEEESVQMFEFLSGVRTSFVHSVFLLSDPLPRLGGKRSFFLGDETREEHDFGWRETRARAPGIVESWGGRSGCVFTAESWTTAEKKRKKQKKGDRKREGNPPRRDQRQRRTHEHQKQKKTKKKEGDGRREGGLQGVRVFGVGGRYRTFCSSSLVPSLAEVSSSFMGRESSPLLLSPHIFR